MTAEKDKDVIQLSLMNINYKVDIDNTLSHY